LVGALETFFKKNKGKIVSEWVSLIRECSQTYAKRPEYEMAESFRKSFDANTAYISNSNPEPIDNHIDLIVGSRLNSGFDLDDIQTAMELFRTVTRPLMLREIPRDNLSECLEKMDYCVDYSIRCLIKRYRKHYEAETRNANMMLSEALVELKVERNNAMAANVLKDQFLANLSHELKTPLTSIIGFSKALMSSPAEQPSVKGKMKVIYDQGRNLLRLINTLLTIAEINSGIAKLGRDAIDMRDMAELAMHGIQKLKDADGRIINFIPCDKELLVIGDSEKLFAVVFELIINGLKFSEPNGDVTVRCAENKGNAAVSVSDKGIGIEAVDIKRMFDPFCQMDGSSTRRYNGSGIGLTMIKKVVELHNGTIAVESVPGKGSTFTIEIPLAR
jgi:signal transduction histidine kinase